MIDFLKTYFCVLFNKDGSKNYRSYIMTDQRGTKHQSNKNVEI